MKFTGKLLAYIGAVCAIANGTAAATTKTQKKDKPSAVASAVLGGQTFVNKGLVGFGLIPSDAKESTGDTIGGIGSAIAIQPGSFKAKKDGTYEGTLIVQPDRGYNVITTIDYQARQHAIDFVLTPYYDNDSLSFKKSKKTLSLTYQSTLLYDGLFSVKTSGLDPEAIRPADADASTNPLAQPQLPIPNSTYQHLSVDAEGLVLNNDGTFWTSDEYGPYIYKYSANGQLLQTIQPPLAITPHVNGALNFSAINDPTTGRSANQGFEGFTSSPDGTTLFALLQSATIQDGGGDKTTNRYTRLLQYSVPANLVSGMVTAPQLVGEFIVPLPQSKKGKTYAQSEIHYLSPSTFLILARDGNGHGDDDTESSYKQIDLFSIAGATNIAGTAFDLPSTPVAPGGVLSSAVTPATYVGFVDMLDDDQLDRFALHNGGDADAQLIDAKWESLALAPVGDDKNPDDYFLFAVADNDFVTTNGVSIGQPYDAGQDVDTQFLVWRVTLPSVSRGSLSKLLR